MASRTLHEALDDFFAHYVAAVKDVTGAPPVTENDASRPSPCTVGQADADGLIRWTPIKQPADPDFSTLDEALGSALHDDSRSWLSRWWAMPIEAIWADESVILNLASGPEEGTALLRRAGRHIAASRSAGRASGVPIAVVMNGGVLVLDNASGQVLYERSNGEVSVVTPTLAAFVDGLRPLPL